MNNESLKQENNFLKEMIRTYYKPEIETLNNIINEVREVIEERCREEFGGIAWYIKNILDKGNKK